MYTNENKYEWVCMGAYGCVGAYEVRGTQKQIKGGGIMVSQALIWALWPGKFPRTSRFGEFSKMGANGFGWVIRGLHGGNGVHLHGGDRKTRRNEAKTGDQGIFCKCGHGQQNIA